MSAFDCTDDDLEFAEAEAEVALFRKQEEAYYEPSELDEWLDFDPDC